MAMRWLRNEQGGTATLFAVFLGTGALIALMAIAVDFGRVYREQQELRNSANSTALAIAWACAYGSSSCADQSSAEDFAEQMLDDNASDSLAVLEELCGDAPLDACDGLSGESMDCLSYGGDRNLVRVTAATASDEGDFLSLFFAPAVSNVDQLQLWHCGQAEWEQGAEAGGNFDTVFDLAFPICDYPGDDSPVVWFRFYNGGNPAVDREIDCVLSSPGGGSVAFDDVLNGAASLEIDVGECVDNVELSVDAEEDFGTSNWRQLCDSEVETFLDTVIDNEESVRVALAGEFDRHSSSNIDITIAGHADLRILGYRFTNQISGGQTPPGGWSDYPEGFPSNQQCAQSKPCIYGYYESVPSVVSQSPTARLVLD